MPVRERRELGPEGREERLKLCESIRRRVWSGPVKAASLGRPDHDDAGQALLGVADGRPQDAADRGARVAVRDGDRVELRLHRRGVRGSFGAGLRHHPHEQIIELIRDLRPELASAGRRLEHELRQHSDDVLAGEGLVTREAAVEDAPERKDIGARVDVGLPHRLLGRHVAWRPDGRARPRGVRVCAGPPHEAKIDQLRLLDRSARQEEVARLHVAVDEAGAVRVRERLGGPAPDHDGLAERQLAALEALQQILTLEPFHHEVRLPARGEPVRDVPHDRRVMDRREHLRLTQESLLRGLVVHRESLYRHRGARRPIQAVEDGPHPAFTDLPIHREAFVDDREMNRHDERPLVAHSQALRAAAAEASRGRGRRRRERAALH